MMNEEALDELNVIYERLSHPEDCEQGIYSFRDGDYLEALDLAIKALEAQPCIEDYPTCTECEHYDSEKHYCPRFCQVIKDTLAEAQPSEDTEVIKVSKGAVKARQGRFVIYDVDWLKENFYTTEEKIYGQPKQPCEDCISRAEMLKYQQYLHGKMSNEENHKLWEFIKGLPSVTPQRPKGKWLHIYKSDIACKCSVCHIQMPITEYYHYCPNCGAEMSGGGEDGEDSACDRD